ncbi:nuclear transport factor 2 family protein [Rhodococcus sp. T2V]|uniref:nuclear transport factor 2 family protein n=1 Tax=Rhodococcus sp. T2V TaxID=3034164 RepID=UPI0023E1570C|nr:nuclear transport factor 2 family protein [Rhodococcus sp. T2V]MDF3309940.1 nuclear transport factor 2 family protein [Rhodococcus sp. T2V]
MTGPTDGIAPATSFDPRQFATDIERITNEGLVDELMAKFAPDAVADWVMDGARDRHVGIDAIRAAVVELTDVCHTLDLKVNKRVECADENTIVMSWTGGFAGADNQFGIEICTLRGGLIVRQQMYSYLDVRSSRSPWASLRLLTVAPRVVAATLRYRRAHGTLLNR